MASRKQDYEAEERVAERFGRNTKTIRRWSTDPEIGFPAPVMRLRGRTYYRVTDIETWEARMAAKAAAAIAYIAQEDTTDA